MCTGGRGMVDSSVDPHSRIYIHIHKHPVAHTLMHISMYTSTHPGSRMYIYIQNTRLHIYKHPVLAHTYTHVHKNTKTQLREECRLRGIKTSARMRKLDLIQMLVEVPFLWFKYICVHILDPHTHVYPCIRQSTPSHPPSPKHHQ